MILAPISSELIYKDKMVWNSLRNNDVGSSSSYGLNVNLRCLFNTSTEEIEMIYG